MHEEGAFCYLYGIAQETRGTKISRSGHIDLAGGTRHYVAEGSSGPADRMHDDRVQRARQWVAMVYRRAPYLFAHWTRMRDGSSMGAV